MIHKDIVIFTRSSEVEKYKCVAKMEFNTWFKWMVRW